MSKKFPKSQSNLLRCKVAESSFLNACGKTEEADILVKQANEIYQKLDQQLTEADSLAIAKSLTDMGQTEFAETVVKKAAEQHFEDNQFIIKAAKLCSQPEILQHCKKASRLNMLGVEYFEKKDFSNAAKTFEQVYELAPSHINMALNYIQTLE